MQAEVERERRTRPEWEEGGEQNASLGVVAQSGRDSREEGDLAVGDLCLTCPLQPSDRGAGPSPRQRGRTVKTPKRTPPCGRTPLPSLPSARRLALHFVRRSSLSSLPFLPVPPPSSSWREGRPSSPEKCPQLQVVDVGSQRR
jgi:hypothetical protein